MQFLIGTVRTGKNAQLYCISAFISNCWPERKFIKQIMKRTVQFPRRETRSRKREKLEKSFECFELNYFWLLQCSSLFRSRNQQWELVISSCLVNFVKMTTSFLWCCTYLFHQHSQRMCLPLLSDFSLTKIISFFFNLLLCAKASYSIFFLLFRIEMK